LAGPSLTHDLAIEYDRFMVDEKKETIRRVFIVDLPSSLSGAVSDASK